ncbi:hypothetical protein GYB22_05665 [bacterium]|nr:hypothetical protein [bacterium]
MVLAAHRTSDYKIWLWSVFIFLGLQSCGGETQNKPLTDKKVYYFFQDRLIASAFEALEYKPLSEEQDYDSAYRIILVRGIQLHRVEHPLAITAYTDFEGWHISSKKIHKTEEFMRKFSTYNKKMNGHSFSNISRNFRENGFWQLDSNDVDLDLNFGEDLYILEMKEGEHYKQLIGPIDLYDTEKQKILIAPFMDPLDKKIQVNAGAFELVTEKF